MTATLTGKVSYSFTIRYGYSQYRNCFSLQDFATSATFLNEIPAEMKKGEAALIMVEAIITAPMTDLEVTAIQPLGYVVSLTLKLCKMYQSFI